MKPFAFQWKDNNGQILNGKNAREELNKRPPERGKKGKTKLGGKIV